MAAIFFAQLDFLAAGNKKIQLSYLKWLPSHQIKENQLSAAVEKGAKDVIVSSLGFFPGPLGPSREKQTT